jgi:DNA-binding MarR family transcriptional regulator
LEVQLPFLGLFSMMIDDVPMEAIPEMCLGMASRLASRMTTKVFGALLAPLDMDATQFPIMLMLRLHSGIVVSALSKLLDIEASAISRNIQALERKGLVISSGGRGRNGKRLALSPDGNEVLDQAVQRWRDAQKMLIAELGEAETKEIRRTMKSLNDAAQRILVREKEMA